MGRKIDKNSIDGNTLMNSFNPDQAAFPDISDLSSRLKFAPQDGRIWLDNRRMFLMDNQAFGQLRKELISNFGFDAARGVLTRMGYQSGTLDAQLANKVRKDRDDFDAFATGPQMHALLGIVKVECIDFHLDQSKGEFYGEYLWHDSIEDDEHINNFGIGEDTACWMQIGYASGFTSAFLGRPVLFREVECRSKGAQLCRIIGKPLKQWHDAKRDIHYLHNTEKMEAPEGLEHTKIRKGGSSSPTPIKQLINLSNNIEKDDNKIIGTSSGFRAVKTLADKVANSVATVLLLGESGVGKEVFANYIHNQSPRSSKPFIAVNCAAIPEDLIESELFGVEKGAYTGAEKSRMGRFERADTGTIFLDEIHTLSFSAQGKLMRAIQEKEIEPLGSVKIKKINVRLITATNVDLKEAVKEGKFRLDLYYRINVFPIHIPALKDRRSDIPLLLEYFLEKFSRLHNKVVNGFSERATMLLFSYHWPGNVREMENVVERGVILAEDNEAIKLNHLLIDDKRALESVYTMAADGRINTEYAKASLSNEQTSNDTVSDNDLIEQLLADGKSFEDIEREIIKFAVDNSNKNLSSAARQIGLTRPQLAYRMNKLGIEPS